MTKAEFITFMSLMIQGESEGVDTKELVGEDVIKFIDSKVEIYKDFMGKEEIQESFVEAINGYVIKAKEEMEATDEA